MARNGLHIAFDNGRHSSDYGFKMNQWKKYGKEISWNKTY